MGVEKGVRLDGMSEEQISRALEGLVKVGKDGVPKAWMVSWILIKREVFFAVVALEYRLHIFLYDVRSDTVLCFPVISKMLHVS